MIASAGMTYAFKFLWAPLLDHWQLPLFARLGRRRGWLLLAQLGVVVGLVAMALLTPAQLPRVRRRRRWRSRSSARRRTSRSMRIASRSRRRSEQGALVATYSLGYRLALILAGAFALILADHMPWQHGLPGDGGGDAACRSSRNLRRARARVRARRAPLRWREAMRAERASIRSSDFFRRYGWRARAGARCCSSCCSRFRSRR